MSTDRIPLEPIMSNHFEIGIYTEYGKEIENIYTSSIKMNMSETSTTINSCIHSTIDCVADYNAVNEINYIHLRIYNKHGEKLKSIIYKVSLVELQCNFAYSLDTSILESDCIFDVTNDYNLELNSYVIDDAIKRIIRSQKIDNILD